MTGKLHLEKLFRKDGKPGSGRTICGRWATAYKKGSGNLWKTAAPDTLCKGCANNLPADAVIEGVIPGPPTPPKPERHRPVG